MRARNLKPGLFKNELLAIADPIYTVTFAGLWCAADRDGRLEDRPARLHMEINPGRAFEVTQRSLEWLIENGFVARYSVGGRNYLHVVEFSKHQNPHHKEPPSTLPAPSVTSHASASRPGLNGHSWPESPGQEADEQPMHEAETLDQPGAAPPMHEGKTLLIPDSGSLIPDPSVSDRGAQARERPRRPRPKPEAPLFDPDHVLGLDRSSWDRWVNYRAQLGKPLKPVSLEAAALELAKYGGDQPAVVQQSIANQWQGLFPLRKPAGRSTSGTPGKDEIQWQ